MQSRTGLWNPFQQEAAKAKNLARASEDLDVYMKNMSIQSKMLNSLKGKAFGSMYSFAGSFRGPAGAGFWQLCLWCCWCFLGFWVAAGSPKDDCSHYGWVGLLELSSLPRAWLYTGFIAWVSSYGDTAGSSSSL